MIIQHTLAHNNVENKQYGDGRGAPVFVLKTRFSDRVTSALAW